MTTRPLVVLGAESLGREAAEIALAAGYRSVSFLDDALAGAPAQVLGLPIEGGFARALDARNDADYFVAVGRAAVRGHWMRAIREAGGRLATLVHPRAEVSASARIGANTMISFGCHIASNVVLGEGNILWSAVIVSHDCTVGNYCFFGPAVAMGGYTHIGDQAMFGCGARLRSCITIGNRVIIGMGAVVIRPVPDEHFVAVGAEAVPIEGRTNEEIYFGRVRTLAREG